MDEDFISCNKKIAAFIITSVSLTTHAALPQANASEGIIMTPDISVQNIMRYAGPPNPVSVETVPITTVKEPAIMRYAGPPIPVINATPVEVQVEPPVLRYAGPQIPSAELNIKNNLIPNEGFVQHFGGYQIDAGHYIFR